MLWNNRYLKKLVVLVIVLGITLSCFASGVVLAQNEGDSKKSTIHIKAGELKNEDGLIYLSGGLTIKKDDITLKSPEGEFNDEENKIVLNNGVDMVYTDAKISAKEMTGYFDNDDFVFENNVKMDYNSGEENDKGKNKKFILESSSLEINSESKSFIAENNIIIDYDDKIIKGNKAEYDDEKELLIVTENVYIREENGDWIKSDKAEFDLGTGKETFTAVGNVEIEISLEDEDD